jgi:hypothetical protein
VHVPVGPRTWLVRMAYLRGRLSQRLHDLFDLDVGEVVLLPGGASAVAIPILRLDERTVPIFGNPHAVGEGAAPSTRRPSYAGRSAH